MVKIMIVVDVSKERSELFDISQRLEQKRTEEVFLIQGLIPSSMSQYYIQLVLVNLNSHFSRLTVNPFFVRICKK